MISLFWFSSSLRTSLPQSRYFWSVAAVTFGKINHLSVNAGLDFPTRHLSDFFLFRRSALGA